MRFHIPHQGLTNLVGIAVQVSGPPSPVRLKLILFVAFYGSTHSQPPLVGLKVARNGTAVCFVLCCIPGHEVFLHDSIFITQQDSLTVEPDLIAPANDDGK